MLRLKEEVYLLFVYFHDDIALHFCQHSTVKSPFQPLKPVCCLNCKTAQFLLHKESPSPQFKEIIGSHPKHINTPCGGGNLGLSMLKQSVRTIFVSLGL